jgi:hypothetical protein
VLLGAGVVGLAAGVVGFSLRKSSINREASALSYQSYADDHSHATTEEWVGILGSAAGAALIAGAIVRYALLPSGATDDTRAVPPATVTFAPLPEGAAVGLMGTF